MKRARLASLLVSCALLGACGLGIEGMSGPEGDASTGSDASIVPTDADPERDDAARLDLDAAGSDGAADAGDAAGDGAAIADAAATDADTGASSDAGPLARTGLRFDGVDDYVRMPRPVADDFTLEAWIRTTTSGAGPNFWDGPPIFHSDINGPNNDFGSALQNGRLSFGMGIPDLTVVGTTDVATGQWVHVAVVRVRSTGTVTLFVNGVQDASRTGMGTGSLTSNPNMEIGANLNNVHFFNGEIDEVRAWNVARTGAQILATMAAPLAGDEPGLVGYWRFDEGSGLTVIDSSPTRANGTLGDGSASTRPSWTPSTAF